MSLSQDNQNKLTVGIVGTGSIGLTAIHWALIHGFIPIAFEQSNSVGGVWNHNSPTNNSPAYDSLFTNSSTPLMNLSDFPFPFQTSTAFPRHDEILTYFKAYSKFMAKENFINFNRKVIQLSKPSSGEQQGKWEIVVEVRGTGEKETHYVDRVIISAGRLWSPQFPPWKKALEKGEIETFHSCQYRNTKLFKGKNVLVVGIGNSALDISLELAQDPEVSSVTVSQRSPTRVLPIKDQFDIPNDIKLGSRFYQYTLKSNHRKSIMELLTKNVNQKMQDYGLNGGNEAMGGNLTEIGFTAQISNLKQTKAYIQTLQQGRISFVYGVEAVDPNNRLILFRSTFLKNNFHERINHINLVGYNLEASESHRLKRIDSIIFCTGYKLNHDFLDSKIRHEIMKNVDLTNEEGEVFKKVQYARLFKNMVYPKDPSLSFLGLFTSLGNETVIGEMQARWTMNYWKKKFSSNFYEQKYMLKQCDKKEKFVKHFKVITPQFLTFVTYMDDLAKDIGCLPETGLGNYWNGAKSLLLWFKLKFYPLMSAQYRLKGPNKLELEDNYLYKNEGNLPTVEEFRLRSKL